ncbi:MAG TPA: plastocyanin/azurin family copper-binding protein [Gemmatimonadales bacterium]|nr:plastocyanin/azurin family copper-binding protein [Gemmatimonadales bacterium]
MRLSSRLSSLLALAALTLAACSKPSDAPAADAAATGAPSDAAAATGPAATGRVIEIKAITDEKGSRFEPAKLEAHPGDVLRVSLVSGVHNLHFAPELNPGVAGLPEASEMLQLPGQTVDVPVTMPPGTYRFQCDPHAALGMVGELEVEKD